MNVLQTIYFSTVILLPPSPGNSNNLSLMDVVDLTVVFILVRTGKEFVKVLNRPVFVLRARILLALTC